MSVKAMSWAWDQQINPGQKLVLLAIADHCDGGGVCWPGQELLAHKCGMNRSTIVAHVRALIEADLMEVEKRRGREGRQASSVYKLNLSRVVNPNPGIDSSRVGKTNVGKTNVGKTNVGISSFPELENPTLIHIMEPSVEPSYVVPNSSQPSEPNATNTTMTEEKNLHVMPGDWTPSAACWDRIEGEGVPRKFADRLLDEFVEFWALGKGRGTKRPGWDRTFKDWAVKKWEDAKNKTPAAGDQRPGQTTNKINRNHSDEYKDYKQEQRRTSNIITELAFRGLRPDSGAAIGADGNPLRGCVDAADRQHGQAEDFLDGVGRRVG